MDSGSGTTLAEAALESLTITVAVIDADGEILLTNRPWREFGPDGSTDHVGVNYVATAEMDADDDEYARRAVEGLECVLEGEQETFAMEYPCHSPEEKRWFLMRANRFTVDGEVRVSVVHLEITDRKLAELAVEETADQLREERGRLEHVLERVDGLLRDVTDAAVGARTRDGIERDVCARLVDTEPYVLAWVGRVDVTNRRLSPREWASSGDVPLEDGELVLGSDESHPAVGALEDGEPVVIDDLEAFDDADRWWPRGAGEAFRSVAALPLSYGDVTYGVLAVFAATADAFTERELLVLESLANTIATGMNAAETRQMLTTDAVVELEVAIEDPALFVTSLAEELGTAITYRGRTTAADGTPTVFLHADDPIEAVPNELEVGTETETETENDGISEVTILSTYDDGTLLEATVDGGPLSTLSEHGATIRRFDVPDVTDRESRATGAVADLAVDLPDGQSARSAYDLLERRYDTVELISYHETDRPTRTPADVMSRLESSLTERQLTALRKAYYADYFEWPRNVSGEDLAQSMDISRSTYHQHLRSAQRKLLDELFDGDPTSEG